MNKRTRSRSSTEEAQGRFSFSRIWRLLGLMLWLVNPLSGLGDDAPGTVPRNLLKSPNNLTDMAWKGFCRQASVSPVGEQVAPDGTPTVFHLQLEGGGYWGQIISSAQAGRTYVFSLWAKAAGTGEERVTLAGEDNAPSAKPVFQSFSVGNEWKRIHIAFSCPVEGARNLRFSIRRGDILLWHPQVEDATGRETVPTEYSGCNLPGLPPLEAKHPPKPGVAQNISCWGDSLTQGTGGTPYPAVLARAGDLRRIKVANEGVGGETSSQILNRFLAAPDQWSDIVIIWAGRNNYMEAETVVSDVARMVEKVKTDRYLVLSVLNMDTETKGTGSYATIQSINQSFSDRYAGNYLDIRQLLVKACDPDKEADRRDQANDVPPTSLRSDGIHLNSAGYALVADQILAFLAGHRWISDSGQFPAQSED